MSRHSSSGRRRQLTSEPHSLQNYSMLYSRRWRGPLSFPLGRYLQLVQARQALMSSHHAHERCNGTSCSLARAATETQSSTRQFKRSVRAGQKTRSKTRPRSSKIDIQSAIYILHNRPCTSPAPCARFSCSVAHAQRRSAAQVTWGLRDLVANHARGSMIQH